MSDNFSNLEQEAINENTCPKRLVEKDRDPNLEGVCVYLTDGYGTFPNSKPELPTLWVITPGGLNLNEIPFGEAVKLSVGEYK